ncbi:MAG: DUF4255 domain-containing protein [Candidatus Promineifilaceae bacterium]
MASYQAIFATCTAICNVLLQARSADLYGVDIENIGCSVFTTFDFNGNIPTDGEVALFLYRVDVNAAQRTMPPRPRYDGIQERRHLPLDLHFLLIPRANQAERQQLILGWMMRVVEDNASIPANLLNSGQENVFYPEEHIEITPGMLTTEEMLRIWDQLPSDFNICVPYCARVVRIESPISTLEGPPVLQRYLDFRG